MRRTVATRIAEQLGIGGEQLLRRVLGHSDGSVTAIYNRYRYVKEMRAVLARWAADLTGDTRSAARPARADRMNTPANGRPALKIVFGPSGGSRADGRFWSDPSPDFLFAESVTSQNWNNILKRG